MEQHILLFGLLPLILLVALFCYLYARRRFIKEVVSALSGLELIIELIKLTQQHRGAQSGLLNGNRDFALKVTGISVEIKQTYESLSDFADKHREINVKHLISRWKKLKKSSFEDAAESYKMHSALITDQLDALWDIADYFALTSSHEPELKRLAIRSIRTIPELAESFGQIRALSVQVASSHSLSSDKKLQLYFILSKIEARTEAIKESLSDEQLGRLTRFTQRIKLGLDSMHLKDEKADELFSEATGVIDSLFDSVTNGLHELEHRVAA